MSAPVKISDTRRWRMGEVNPGAINKGVTVKLLMSLISILFPVCFFGCNSTETKPDQFSLGVYQWDTTYSDGSKIVSQTEFKDEGGFSNKGWAYYSDTSCVVYETSAIFSYSGKSISLNKKKARSRGDCSLAFSAFVDRPASTHELRNISGNSFEIFIASDEDAPARWMAYTKI